MLGFQLDTMSDRRSNVPERAKSQQKGVECLFQEKSSFLMTKIDIQESELVELTHALHLKRYRIDTFSITQKVWGETILWTVIGER